MIWFQRLEQAQSGFISQTGVDGYHSLAQSDEKDCIILGNFLTAKAGSGTSWGWKTVLEGLETRCEMPGNKVRDGCRTRIWEDSWIPSLASSF